jgi:hypothetical protein
MPNWKRTFTVLRLLTCQCWPGMRTRTRTHRQGSDAGQVDVVKGQQHQVHDETELGRTRMGETAPGRKDVQGQSPGPKEEGEGKTAVGEDGRGTQRMVL